MTIQGYRLAMAILGALLGMVALPSPCALILADWLPSPRALILLGRAPCERTHTTTVGADDIGKSCSTWNARIGRIAGYGRIRPIYPIGPDGPDGRRKPWSDTVETIVVSFPRARTRIHVETGGRQYPYTRV